MLLQRLQEINQYMCVNCFLIFQISKGPTRVSGWRKGLTAELIRVWPQTFALIEFRDFA